MDVVRIKRLYYRKLRGGYVINGIPVVGTVMLWNTQHWTHADHTLQTNPYTSPLKFHIYQRPHSLRPKSSVRIYTRWYTNPLPSLPILPKPPKPHKHLKADVYSESYVWLSCRTRCQMRCCLSVQNLRLSLFILCFSCFMVCKCCDTRLAVFFCVFLLFV